MTTSQRLTVSAGTVSERSRSGFWRRVVAGIVGGVAGGVVFGALMAMMGMLPMIAMMVGSESAVVGFGVHIMISIVFGLGLTVLFSDLVLTSYPRGLVAGLVYGVIWWVLGPLVIMPLMMGMPLFVINTMALWSLLGHLVYGAILGVTAVAVLARRR